jgi:hypothetical protein
MYSKGEELTHTSRQEVQFSDASFQSHKGLGVGALASDPRGGGAGEPSWQRGSHGAGAPGGLEERPSDDLFDSFSNFFDSIRSMIFSSIDSCMDGEAIDLNLDRCGGFDSVSVWSLVLDPVLVFLNA